MDIRQRIDEANQLVIQGMERADPVLMEVGQAKHVIPGMRSGMILHAGPPIEWDRMCPPMKHGIIGGALYEGMAESPDEVASLVQTGELVLRSCHEHSAVGSMTGITTPSMWVYVVEDRQGGGRAYSAVYEGRGKTLAFGCYEYETIDRLRWMEETYGPALQQAVRKFPDGLSLKPIVSRALHMGDEGHNRYVASTLWYMDELVKAFLATDVSKSKLLEFLKFMTEGHYNSFLTLSMAGCKAIADAGHGVQYGTVVTAMARNGTDFGIRVSGLGNDWFVAPAQKVEGLYFPGYDQSTANADIGDSTITETVGLGGFALPSAPETLRLVGKGLDEAIQFEQEMSEITVGRAKAFTLPYLNFRGTPLGIDVRKVVESSISPVCVTAIASTVPNTGMIGAGIVRQPLQCFRSALEAFSVRYEL